MKPTDSQKKRIKGWISKWRPRLFLGEWHLNLTYSKFSHEASRGNYRIQATCDSDPVYMNALITIFPEFWDRTVKQQEEILVHEMAHCLTQSVWNCMKSLHQGELITPDNMRSEIEQLTQRISNIAFQGEW